MSDQQQAPKLTAWTALHLGEVAQASWIVATVGAGAERIAKVFADTGCPVSWLGITLSAARVPIPLHYEFARGKRVCLLRVSTGEADQSASRKYAIVFTQAGAAEVRECCVGWSFTDPATQHAIGKITELVTLGPVFATPAPETNGHVPLSRIF